MSLSQAIAREYELGDRNTFLVCADTIIPEGVAVGLNSEGYAKPLAFGDPFVGFCEDTSDNICGKDGDRRVQVKHCGKIKLIIDGLELKHVGQAVFASDAHTFTLTAEHNSRIGVLYRVEADGSGIVAFNASFGH